MRTRGAARALLLVIAWLACAAAIAEPYVHPQTRIAFPDEIAGMRRAEVADYESKHPGLGISVRYVSHPGLWADVFLYNLGMQSIPDDSDTPVMAKLRQMTGNEVVTALKQKGIGVRKGESLALDVQTAKGPVKVLYDSFVVLAPTGAENTFVWLWPGRNHFVKIRMTRRGGDHDPAKVREFYEAVVRLTR